MPFALFIAYPALAGLIAVGFLQLDRRRPRLFIRVTSLLWLFYCFYELGMKRRILCSGECNIRVDLLVIYPILLAMSIGSIALYIRASREAP